MLRRIIAVSGALSFALLLPATAGAHGAWVAERWGELGVIYGHGAGDDAYDPARITQAIAIAEDGAAAPVTIDKRDKHAVLKPEGEPAAIALTFDNGYWSEKADGTWVNEPKDKVADAKATGHYIKNSLSLLHVHDALPVFPKQDLQIVPLDNPIGRKAGDPIRLRVLHDGKPLAGAVVTLDYINQAALKSEPTDADGEVVVAIRNDGLNVLSVDHGVPLENDPKADKIGYTATLSFVAEAHKHDD
jgi:nickel transport protein